MRFPSDDEIRKMEDKALKRARKIQRRIKAGKSVGQRQVRRGKRTVNQARNGGRSCLVAVLSGAVSVARLRGWV